MKTAFITGARGGLGLALAREFASAGWGLILHSRRPMDHAGFDFKTLFLTGDFSNPMTVDHCVDFIGKRAVDVLVNNAAAYDTGRVEDGEGMRWWDVPVLHVQHRQHAVDDIVARGIVVSRQ